jgi:hypothetical protein
MALTLISHVWNEAFLLPYWLRHHYPMFDHGVIVDYASTDGSMDLVRQFAPGWEIRRSRNKMFDARLNDQEIMDVEQGIEGWKIVLNTTEFLLHPDLRAYLKWMDRYRTDVHGIWAVDFIMVDRPEDADDPVTDEPLHFQKRFGYLGGGGRSRMMHRDPHGRYGIGRHASEIVAKVLDDGLLLLWFGWSPIKHVWQRKLAIQKMIPESDKRIGFGTQHNVTEEQMRDMYDAEVPKCVDLMESCPRYREVIEELQRARRTSSVLQGSLPIDAAAAVSAGECSLVVDGQIAAPTAEFSLSFAEDTGGVVTPTLFHRGRPVAKPWSLAIKRR